MINFIFLKFLVNQSFIHHTTRDAISSRKLDHNDWSLLARMANLEFYQIHQTFIHIELSIYIAQDVCFVSLQRSTLARFVWGINLRLIVEVKLYHPYLSLLHAHLSTLIIIPSLLLDLNKEILILYHMLFVKINKQTRWKTWIYFRELCCYNTFSNDFLYGSLKLLRDIIVV